MGKTLPQLVAVVRQKSNTDGVSGGNQVVTDTELAGYINEAVRALYDLIISVDSSYYESSLDFTLASSPTGNIAALPGDFYKERGLVLFPDTERETPVYFVPFAERTRGRLGATLDGNSIKVFPWQLAGQGPWRIYYTPKPVLFEGDFTALAVMSDADVIAGIGPFTQSGGPGPGKTLTSTIPGVPLVIDGITLSTSGFTANGIPDRCLLRFAPGSDTLNGVWAISQNGSGGTPWKLVRATDFDQLSATEVRAGARISVSKGVTKTNTVWQVVTFAGPIDSVAMPIAEMVLDVTMDNFDEYITNKVALVVITKRQMPDPGGVAGLFQMSEARVKSMATMRLSEPEQAPLLWRGSSRYSRYYDDLA